jgi:hypothetical protein
MIYDDRRGKCFGCGWHGDVIDYIEATRGVDLPRAIELLEAATLVPMLSGRAGGHDCAAVSEYEFTLEERTKIAGYCNRIIEDEFVQNKIASSRGWQVSTIISLAEEGSLGWFGGGMAFIYPHGVKIRNFNHHDFEWLFGRSGLWRGGKIAEASHICLTEGETDAISLIDSGLENKYRGHVVCAVSGANGFKESWAPQFSGKNVTLCFDDDKAGNTATQKVGDLLILHTDEVSNFSVKGFSNE